ncbi:MAG: 33 kDa chaperonin [Holosporales bacterium]
MMKDCVIPFSLFACSQKGRLVSLNTEMQKIIDQHHYPELVNQFLIELMAILTVIGSDTKSKCVVSLQINADALSPISLLVADLESNGNMRSYARFDAEKLKSYTQESALEDIFQNGYMVFTIDFDTKADRYQAVVELLGGSLTESIEHYCKQSDQIPTAFSIHINTTDAQQPKAVALMLQQLPVDQNTLMSEREEKIDQWSTILHFIKTIKREEALSTDPSTLLFRLFHDVDLAIAKEKKLQFQCRCSLEKITNLIASFPQAEVDAMTINNEIVADCEFCGAHYTVSLPC